MVQQSEDDGEGDGDGDGRVNRNTLVLSLSSRKRSFFYFFWHILIWFFLCMPTSTFINASYSEPDLVVHIVPHSHVDAGWLETSDEYYDNSVSAILTSVLNQLDHDVKRRFVWAEVMFFRRWYEALSQLDKNRVHRVIKDGQLEFVGGGWVQHDEALSSWQAIVQQVSSGHAWLLKNFGIRPTIGWQIDAAGHSDVTPSLFGLMGYEALVINRIHYRIKKQFKTNKHMEFFWKGADVGGQVKPLLTHVLAEHFSAPEGCDFESAGVRQVTNAKRRSDRLVKQMRERAAYYRTHHLMVPFGDDLRFKAADKQFTNMEKLLRYINEKQQDVEFRFSTAAEYFSAMRRTAAITSLKLPFFQGDFFPYADNGESYWSGAYSTRPLLKRSIQTLNARVRSSDVLFALARSRANVVGGGDSILRIDGGHVVVDHNAEQPNWGLGLYDSMYNARLTAAQMSQHHAITGLSRQYVVDDYLSQIEQGIDRSNEVIIASLEQLLMKRKHSSVDGQQIRPPLSTLPFNFENDMRNGLQHPIIFHNHFATKRIEVFHMELDAPFASMRHLQVQDAFGNSVQAQVYQTLMPDDGSQGANNDKKWMPITILSFLVEIPPFGVATYFVHTTSARERLNNKLSGASLAVATVYEIDQGEVILNENQQNVNVRGTNNMRQKRQQKQKSTANQGGNGPESDGIVMANEAKQYIIIENEILKVEVEIGNGLIKAIEDKRVERRTLLRQQFLKYNSPRSGAYLFRPDRSPDAFSLGSRLTVSVVEGPLVFEINILGHNGASQRVRLYKAIGLNHIDAVEIEGHVDVSHIVTPEIDSDIVVRYETSMNTNGMFYTDNTLGDLIQRQTHKDAPTASNYYPITSTAVLRDNQATSVSRMGQLLAIISPQPLAVSSPILSGGGNAGLLDLMLHRSHSQDDGRGLNEGLDDFTTQQFDFMIAVDIPSTMEVRLPSLADRTKFPLLPVFALEEHIQQMLNRESWLSRFRGTFSYMNADLNNNLRIDSFYAKDTLSDEIIFRVRNIASHGSPLSINPSDIFVPSKRIYGVRARTLDMSAPEKLLREMKQGTLAHDSSESNDNGDGPLHLSHETFDSAASYNRRNSEEKGVFLSEHASQASQGSRKLLGFGGGNSDPKTGGLISLSSSQIRSFFIVFVTLKDNEIPIPGKTPDVGGQHRNRNQNQHRNQGNSRSNQRHDTQVPHHTQTDPPSTTWEMSPPPTQLTTTTDDVRQALVSKIDKDEKMVSFLEKKLKSSQSLIDDVLSELKLTSDEDIDDRAELEAEVQKLRQNLQEVGQKLDLRRKELEHNQNQLKALNAQPKSNYYEDDNDDMSPEMRDKIMMLKGAGGMTLLYLIINNVCTKARVMPKVPIKWVGFGDNDAGENLPLHNEKEK